MDNPHLNTFFTGWICSFKKAHEGMSPMECASELGISKTSFLKFAQGEGNPTLETIQTIADHRHCDPRIILGGSSEADFLLAQLLMQCLDNGQKMRLNRVKEASDHLAAFVQIMAEEVMLAAEKKEQETKQGGQPDDSTEDKSGPPV